MLETALTFGAVVALIVGLVEVFKRIGLADKYAPALALVCGVALAFGVLPETTIGLTVVNGLIYGLSASGLYSQFRATTGI